MLRTVTVGVDGSPDSLAAAEWAAQEAQRRDVPLRLVHAHRRPRHEYAPVHAANRRQPRPDTSSGGVASEPDRVLAEAESRVASRHPHLTTSIARISAEPLSALLTAAEHAELVVLGSRTPRESGPGSHIGSVALALVARSSRPVILVREAARSQDERQPADTAHAASVATAFRDVVLGLDLTDPHDAVIEFAFDAASRREARLRVVHGWSPKPHSLGEADANGTGRWAEPNGAARGDALFEALDPWRHKFPEVEVVEQAVIGKAGAHLSEAARDASLVVVGHTARRTPAIAAIGLVTQAVLQHSTAPVAVVPHT